MDELIGQLSESTYWQKEYKIKKVELSKLRVKNAENVFGQMIKDQEIAKLRAQLYKGGVEALKTQEKSAENELDEMTQVIAKELGCDIETLKSAIIDDVTYEVRKLDVPESPDSKPAMESPSQQDA